MINSGQGGNILVVEDDPDNLRALVAILKRGGFAPRPVTSGKRALEAAFSDPPDLVLLDVMMPGMSGYEVCRTLKQDARFKNTPVIFLSALQDTQDKVLAFGAGCVDYISKPFHYEEVLARVTTHLQLRRLQDDLASHNLELEQRVAVQVKAVTASQMATIFALAKLAETRDDETGHHIERVQTFSKLLAMEMCDLRCHVEQLTPSFVETLYQTAALHDIGKVGIADAVLLKPGKLTREEFAEMKKHSVIGAQTLQWVLERYPDNEFLRMGVDVARSHHEKWDGSGYPDGLNGEAIPLSARVVALADFYDALTSRRCYREAFSHEDTLRMIEEGGGTHFEPAIIESFKAQESKFKRIREEMQDRY
jgi:putative two-component system response regulator